jgi:hypothetical protein
MGVRRAIHRNHNARKGGQSGEPLGLECRPVRLRNYDQPIDVGQGLGGKRGSQQVGQRTIGEFKDLDGCTLREMAAWRYGSPG